MLLRRIVATLVAAALTWPALGGTPPALPLPNDLHHLAVLYGGSDEFVKNVMIRFRTEALGKDAVTRENMAELLAVRRAQRRGTALGTILSYDVDGDGHIRKTEIDTTIIRNPSPQRAFVPGSWPIESERDAIMAVDRNGDGAVSFAEAMAALRQTEWEGKLQTDPLVLAMLASEPDGDGKLTAAEAETLARAAFADIDHDADGTITDEESRAYLETFPR